jgi:hypothetical protein
LSVRLDQPHGLGRALVTARAGYDPVYNGVFHGGRRKGLRVIARWRIKREFMGGSVACVGRVERFNAPRPVLFDIFNGHRQGIPDFEADP